MQIWPKVAREQNNIFEIALFNLLWLLPRLANVNEDEIEFEGENVELRSVHFRISPMSGL